MREIKQCKGQCKDFLNKRKQIQTILLKHTTEFLNRKFSLKICKNDTAIFVVKSIKEKWRSRENQPEDHSSNSSRQRTGPPSGTKPVTAFPTS